MSWSRNAFDISCTPLPVVFIHNEGVGGPARRKWHRNAVGWWTKGGGYRWRSWGQGPHYAFTPIGPVNAISDGDQTPSQGQVGQEGHHPLWQTPAGARGHECRLMSAKHFLHGGQGPWDWLLQPRYSVGDLEMKEQSITMKHFIFKSMKNLQKCTV